MASWLLCATMHSVSGIVSSIQPIIYLESHGPLMCALVVVSFYTMLVTLLSWEPKADESGRQAHYVITQVLNTQNQLLHVSYCSAGVWFRRLYSTYMALTQSNNSWIFINNPCIKKRRASCMSWLTNEQYTSTIKQHMAENWSLLVTHSLMS